MESPGIRLTTLMTDQDIQLMTEEYNQLRRRVAGMIAANIPPVTVLQNILNDADLVYQQGIRCVTELVLTAAQADEYIRLRRTSATTPQRSLSSVDNSPLTPDDSPATPRVRLGFDSPNTDLRGGRRRRTRCSPHACS